MTGPSLRVHLVCTANVCRSVMAQALLRRAAPASVEVSSSGLLATGTPPDPMAIAVLADLGLRVDPETRSHRVTRHDLQSTDLVLGLATHHVRDVVVLDRRLFPKSFALGELVDLSRRRGPRANGEAVAQWLGRMHEGRTTESLLVEHSAHDIVDPTGGPREAFEQTARSIAQLIDELVRSLALPGARSASGAMPSLAGTRPVEVVTDRASVAVARAVLGPVDLLQRLHVADTWDDAATRARALSQGANTLVVCLTVEPHGVAIAANRDPQMRAVVVSNPGMVARSLRRLDANLFCVPSGLDAGVLSQMVEAVRQSDAPRALPDQEGRVTPVDP